jgi:hypothetical protein
MLSGTAEFTRRGIQDPRLAPAATPTPPWRGTTFSKDYSGGFGAAMKLEGMLAVVTTGRVTQARQVSAQEPT